MLACRNHPDVLEGVRHCSHCGGPFCPDCVVTIHDRLFCATCKNEYLLDVRSGVDRTRLNHASILSRFGALVIDYFIINLPPIFIMLFLLFATVRNGQPNVLINFISLPFVVINIIYEALMLSMKNGQTLGKMALKIRVVRPDGSPISTGQAWGRAAMRKLFLMTCLWIINYIPTFFTDERTALHDMAAGTRVIETY